MSRGWKIAFLSGGAALALIAGTATAFRGFLLEEWWFYRWSHAEGPEKEKHFQALIGAGSVLALRCLEDEGILYLVDVGGRGRSRKGGAFLRGAAPPHPVHDRVEEVRHRLDGERDPGLPAPRARSRAASLRPGHRVRQGGGDGLPRE